MTIPIGVLGAGSFGTCLAILAAQQNKVSLWVRNSAQCETIEKNRENQTYLPGVAIPENVHPTSSISECVRDKEMLIWAVPSHGVRTVLEQAALDIHPDAILVSTIKGIENGTCKLMHEVFSDCLTPIHHSRFVALSGPSFAKEVAHQLPTLVTLASEEETFAISVQATLSCAWFRCYSQNDVVGVELAGALKNVIAIAVGISDGLELGNNARAAIMTRGLAEITRLGEARGADPRTFQGLAGMGDLVLTCTGDLSRNRQVGLALGRGQALEDILAKMDQVAEGVRTAESACELARRLEIEVPILSTVRDVLRGHFTATEAVARLMGRQLKSETD